MKKFEPKVGGHRFRLDDLMLMQQAYQEAIAGLISTIHPSLNCVISGAKASVSGGQQNITDGFVSFKGEVFSVQAATFPFQASPARLFLKVAESIILPSPVVYQDQTNQNVHLERIMVAKYYNTADGDDAGVNGMYYTDLTHGGFQPGIVIEWDPMYPGEEKEVWDITGLGVGRMTGWAICNGLNQTPDLRGRFTFMPSEDVYNPASLPTNVNDGTFVGNPYGEKETHILQANLPDYQLPVNDPGHAHAYHLKGMNLKNDGTTGDDYSGSGESPQNFVTDSKQTGITVGSGGGNKALSNIPPSMAMYKIKRITY